MSDNIFEKIPELNHIENVRGPEDAQEMLSFFQEVVISRRSVRVYENTPIPDSVVQDCLNLALKAPSSSNLQPAEFYRIKTPEIRKQLILFCFNQPAARTSQELIVCVARTKTWKKNAKQMLELFKEQEKLGQTIPKSATQYYSKLVPFVYTQGFLGLLGAVKGLGISVAGIFKVLPREPHSNNDMKIWAVKSAALACQNLMLAFRAHGYDTCPMEGYDSKRIKKLLKLPSDAEVVMVVSAGKRAPNGVYGPQIRFDRDQFVFEI